MSKLIELVTDVWNFGCKGDVIKVADNELAKLDSLATKLGTKLYKDFVDVTKRVTDAVEAEVVSVEPKVADAIESKKAK